MKHTTLSRLALVLVLGLVLVSIIVAVGCSNRVTGSQKTNQKPVAYFVNIPPDGSSSSRNPLVYWVGTDPDGLVRYFRYVVVMKSKIDSLGLTAAEYGAQHLSGLDRATWESPAYGGVYLKVDDSLPNTQTQATVNLSADLTDPVNSFVPQYVFLQAIDDQGAFSDLAIRLLKRNDNPPTTAITFLNYDEKASPFINSATSGGLITGVRFRLDGSDPDYPVNPPPFDFQWKLFGPYTYDSTLATDEYRQMLSLVLDTVFVSNDAKVYYFGKGEYIVFFCDSIDSVHDSIIRVPCDTLFIDTITRDNLYGKIKRIANVDDPTFKANQNLYRPVDSSMGWVSGAYDTVFNVYRNAPSDVTIQRRFLLWARCRDDASVADLTPAFSPCGVIEPKYERDVLVVDFDKAPQNARINNPVAAPNNALIGDTAYQYWRRTLETWNPNAVFDSIDFIKINRQEDQIALVPYLQHKVAIMYNDDVVKSGWYNGAGGLSDAAAKTLKAVDAGVNVWFCMRAPFLGDGAVAPTFYRPDPQFQVYFGVDSARYTGWSFYANLNIEEPQTQRIEDFVGAYTLQPGWPALNLDTANLHKRYQWRDCDSYDCRLRWIDSLHALPEVGWAFRRNGTQPLYLYKSLYGAVHPLGQSFSYDGAPVAHRTETNFFRTVFFAFTPLSLQDDTGQIIVDSVMNWLFDNQIPAPPTVSQDRYPNAPIRVSASQIQKFDAERTEAVLRERAKRTKVADPLR